MLVGPDERTIVSSLGWVDRESLWILDAAAGRARSARIGDAQYLSLHAGRAGHFAAVHHYDGRRLLVTAHAFARPEEVLGRCVISGTECRMEGSPRPWEDLPRHYVAFLVQPVASDYTLVTVGEREVSLQTFVWYDDSFDKDDQGIVGVTEVPGSNLVLVSVQRSSVHFRRVERELWADDYDSLLKIEPGTWRILRKRRVQGAPSGTGQFIGRFAFDHDESICAVARPFSGDVVGLSPRSLRTTHRAKLGKQPLEVALLRDGTVFARDWKSGELLQGRLRRAWFG